MHYVHPDLADSNYTRNMSAYEFSMLSELGLGQDDVMVIPEIINAAKGLDLSSAIASYEKLGGLVVRLLLGKHDNGHNRHLRSMIHLASSHYLRKQHLTPGPVLDVPLDPSIYAAAAEQASWRGSKEDGCDFLPLDRDDLGGPLVLVDDDSNYLPDLLGALVRAFSLRSRPPPHPTVRRFQGLTRDETIAHLKRAKVFVDLYLPGKEFAYVTESPSFLVSLYRSRS
jgi:hypothetical protein